MFCKTKIYILFIILKLLHKSNTRLVKKIQNQQNYLQNIINSEDLLSTQFYCPQKCICETNSPNIISNQIDNIESYNVKSIKSTFFISIYCHRGGLNNSDFFNILRQIKHPKVITIIEIRAPTNRPNNFQWNDNLNRFTQLKKLTLINCKIPTLSQSVRLTSLQFLDLSYNKIDEIQIGTFKGLPSLQTLDLSHNQIKSLPTGAFMYSKKLQKLSISHNILSSLSASILRGPQHLTELELDGNNKITSEQLNDLFSDVEMSLERLEINNCKLNNKGIENLKFSRVPLLKRLGIGGNNLTEVPSSVIRTLKHLQTIDLSQNKIKTLQPCAFCACNITRVFLSNNLLGLNTTNSNLKQKKTINTIHNEAFAETHILELDLSYNYLTTFDSRYLHNAQSKIEILHLSGNNLNKLDEKLIHTLPALTSLHLAENKIKKVPFSLSKPYSQLKFLNLSGNLLDDLPLNIKTLLPILKTLDLSKNKFSSFSTNIITTFIEKLKNLYIYDNPWDCECGVQNLQQYMLQRLNNKNRLNYEKTLCDKPALLHGHPLYRVQKINDCAVLFGANYGLNQINELLLLLIALIVAAFLVFILVLLMLHCGQEQKQKVVYLSQQHPLDIIRDTNDITSMRLLNDPLQSSASGLFLNKNEQINNLINNTNSIDTNNNTFKNKLKTNSKKQTNHTPPPPGTLFVMF